MLAINKSAVASRVAVSRPRAARTAAPRRALIVKASNSQYDSQFDSEALKGKLIDSYTETTTKIKVTWEKTEDKPVVLTLAVASVVGLVALNAVADAINRIPLIGSAMELVGICATTWFTYRYLVFGPDREELKQNVIDFVKKVQGK